MEAKVTVQARHPAAKACRREAPLGEGRQAQACFWFVFPGEGEGPAFLGRGPTEADAWRRAAAVVLARTRVAPW